jgi:hypothetical protein
MYKYLLLLLSSLAIILPFSANVSAQGSGGYCLRIDQKESCRFSSMEECNKTAAFTGGYCADNYRLYTSSGGKRYCLADRFGTRCIYNSRSRCVNAAGRKGAEGAACVDNYRLSDNERRKKQESGAADCEPTDFTCLSESYRE